MIEQIQLGTDALSREIMESVVRDLAAAMQNPKWADALVERVASEVSSRTQARLGAVERKLAALEPVASNLAELSAKVEQLTGELAAVRELLEQQVERNQEHRSSLGRGARK